MDPFTSYVLFAVGVLNLTIGNIASLVAAKENNYAAILLGIVFNMVGASAVLYALLQIVPPAFGIH